MILSRVVVWIVVSCAMPANAASDIWRAAYQGELESVKQYIHQGVAVDAHENKNRATPLLLAARRGHIAIVEFLLSKGADPQFANKDGMTALMAASAAGNTDIVKVLVRHRASVSVADNEAFTALTHAASAGHDDVCALLIDNGAPVDGADRGPSPLLLAVINQRRSTVQLLLQKGANPRAQATLRGGVEVTPLDAAQRYGYHDLRAQMLSHIETAPDVEPSVTPAR